MRDSRRRLLTFVLLWIVGTLVLLLRNPDPLLHPVLYAEDGPWMGALLSGGFADLLLHARGDYFVWGNVLLLYLALGINHLLFGFDITHLPQVVAVVSCAFLAAIAALAVVALEGAMSLAMRLLMFVLLLLMPLGATANEVLGRIGNLGLAFMVLCCVLLMWRERHAPQARLGFATVLVDVLVIVCVGTNPVCLPVALAYLAWRMWRDHKRGVRVQDLALAALLLGFGAWVGIRMAGFKPYADVAVVAATVHNLVEFAVARQLLFPFVFRAYGKLSTAASLILLALWLFLLWRGMRARTSGRFVGWMIASCLAAFTAATVVMRPLLLNFLHDYASTAPDRYYYAHGMLAVMLTLWAVDRLLRAPDRLDRRAGYAAVAALTLLYAASMPRLFELRGPNMAIATGPTFVEQLRASRLEPGGAFAMVPSYPSTDPPSWQIKVPARYVEATVDKPGAGRYLRP